MYNWKDVWDISEAVLIWLSIVQSPTVKDMQYAVENYEVGHVPNLISLQHSSLFKRILKKQKLFLYPPPKSYSYPWYELLEKGEDDIVEHHAFTDNNKKMISINQSQWEIIGENKLRYTINEDIYYEAKIVERNNKKYIVLTYNPNE